MRRPVLKNTNTRVIWNCHWKKKQNRKKDNRINVAGFISWPELQGLSEQYIFFLGIPLSCFLGAVSANKADWKLKEEHYTALKITSSVAVQELKLEFFFPTVWTNLACDAFEWHEKLLAGCESSPLSSFLTFKICLAESQPSPPPALIHFALLFSWLRKTPNEKKHYFPIVKRAFTPLENIQYICRPWITHLVFPST